METAVIETNENITTFEKPAPKQKPKLKRKKANVNINECVSCGTCAKHCPRKAITIYKGLYATVNEEKCVGCGLCVRMCPASVISLKEALPNG